MNVPQLPFSDPSFQQGEDSAVQNVHVWPAVVVNRSSDVQACVESRRRQTPAPGEQLQHSQLRGRMRLRRSGDVWTLEAFMCLGDRRSVAAYSSRWPAVGSAPDARQPHIALLAGQTRCPPQRRRQMTPVLTWVPSLRIRPSVGRAEVAVRHAGPGRNRPVALDDEVQVPGVTAANGTRR